MKMLLMISIQIILLCSITGCGKGNKDVNGETNPITIKEENGKTNPVTSLTIGKASFAEFLYGDMDHTIEHDNYKSGACGDTVISDYNLIVEVYNHAKEVNIKEVTEILMKGIGEFRETYAGINCEVLIDGRKRTIDYRF